MHVFLMSTCQRDPSAQSLLPQLLALLLAVPPLQTQNALHTHQGLKSSLSCASQIVPVLRVAPLKLSTPWACGCCEIGVAFCFCLDISLAEGACKGRHWLG